MPMFQVRNRRSRMVLGEVVAPDACEVLEALKDATGSSIEEIAEALGDTVAEAKTNLEIVEIKNESDIAGNKRQARNPLPPRHLYG